MRRNDTWLWVLLGALALLAIGGAGTLVYTMTRGLRNNNPGDLEGTGWYLQTASDGPFAVFASPPGGLRALMINLHSYAREGLTTLRQIVSKWAPPTENDTAGYIAAGETYLSVPVDQPLDMTDPATYINLASFITHQEQGVMPYSDADFQNAIALGDGGANPSLLSLLS